MSIALHHQQGGGCLPRNVRGIEGTESDGVFVISHVCIGLQSEDLRVAHIGTVNEGA